MKSEEQQGFSTLSARLEIRAPRTLEPRDASTSIPAVSTQSAIAVQQEHFVDATGVAIHLKIKKRQVLALTRAGKLPAHPIDPAAERKIWRYRLSEIDATIAGNLSEVQTASARYNDARQPRHQKAR